MPTGVYVRKKKTHCKYGHPFAPENTYVTPKGHQECRICKRRNHSNWRKANPEKKRSMDHTHYVKNAELIQSQTRAYYADNRQDVLERNRNWKKENADKVRDYNRNRRAKKKGSFEKLPAQAEAHLLSLQRDCCFYCKQPFGSHTPHVEHMVPLSRGGPNTMENIVLACRSCNLRKGTMTAEEFLASGKLSNK